MTAPGQTKKNLMLDVTLLKQQQVQINEGMQNLQAMANAMAQEMNQVSNAQSIWLESLRLVLVEKGIMADEDLKNKAAEVGERLKQQAMMEAQAAGMGPGVPPVEEELDGDSVDDLDTELDDADEEDYPV